MLRRNSMPSPKKKKGQSTVEYIILFAVVVAAILTLTNLGFKDAFTGMVNGMTNQMGNMGGRLQGSYPLSNLNP